MGKLEQLCKLITTFNGQFYEQRAELMASGDACIICEKYTAPRRLDKWGCKHNRRLRGNDVPHPVANSPSDEPEENMEKLCFIALKFKQGPTRVNIDDDVCVVCA